VAAAAARRAADGRLRIGGPDSDGPARRTRQRSRCATRIWPDPSRAPRRVTAAEEPAALPPPAAEVRPAARLDSDCLPAGRLAARSRRQDRLGLPGRAAGMQAPARRARLCGRRLPGPELLGRRQAVAARSRRLPSAEAWARMRRPVPLSASGGRDRLEPAHARRRVTDAAGAPAADTPRVRATDAASARAARPRRSRGPPWRATLFYLTSRAALLLARWGTKPVRGVRPLGCSFCGEWAAEAWNPADLALVLV
jgi:hypothetical protein